MAKITIKDLYYGDKYAVMSEVFKTMFLASPNKASVDEQTALELEIVRQTLIAVEKMKKNGDCIDEGKLGDTVTVSVSEPTPTVLLLTVTQVPQVTLFLLLSQIPSLPSLAFLRRIWDENAL